MGTGEFVGTCLSCHVEIHVHVIRWALNRITTKFIGMVAEIVEKAADTLDLEENDVLSQLGELIKTLHPNFDVYTK